MRFWFTEKNRMCLEVDAFNVGVLSRLCFFFCGSVKWWCFWTESWEEEISLCLCLSLSLSMFQQSHQRRFRFPLIQIPDLRLRLRLILMPSYRASTTPSSSFFFPHGSLSLFSVFISFSSYLIQFLMLFLSFCLFSLFLLDWN